MIAWTVATPNVMEMATEAAARIQNFGGVETLIFPCSSKEECHKQKLSIWLEFKSPCWFVDSDLWMLRQANLPHANGAILLGNPDNMAGLKYDKSVVDASQAINSSLVCMDMSNISMRDCVKRAIGLQQNQYGESPKEDEKFLNIAAWSGKQTIAIARLSTQWNWCSETPPKHAIAVHAASQSNKLQWLKNATSYYERH